MPARHFRCTLKSGRHQTQGEVHSIARVSSHPYPAKNALASSRACSRVRMSRPQPPARKIIPIEISGWPVARESHLEDPAHGRARKAATRADAGGDSSNGYWYIRIDGKGYLGHRLAWLYMHGHFPDGMLDHKNHNRSSCRIADLRKATQSQNAANTNLRATSTSGFKGVCWHKKHNKYRAQIGFRGKVVELGFYNTAREAARAYDYVAARVFGEFALTNKQLGLLNSR